MKHCDRRLGRRAFVGSLVATGLAGRCALGFEAASVLEAGEGVVDVTPPLGIELAGFHRAAGKERRIQGIRQASAVRALVLQHGGTQAAIVSLDMACIDRSLARSVQSQVEQQWGIPAVHVRVCATHTHSMPTLRYLRQWGAVPTAYRAEVEKKIVEAVGRAKADLAPTELYVGKSRAVGGNHNRTTKQFKTDEQLTKESSDAERWLDTLLQVLHFRRAGGKRDLLWYHFSAHPVCFADDLAGPDWPGLVAEKVRVNEKLEPSFLQGHIGDVNPGDGDPWRGDAEETVQGVYPALQRALASAEQVKVDRLRLATTESRLPLDIVRFQSWLSEYQTDPAQCTKGTWVDAGFAADWFAGARKWDLQQTYLPVPLSAMQLGDVGLVFHPAELYSYYGLAIRRDSPLPTTLVVGYTDDAIGYLADPNAYTAGEYAAVVTPKILDLPPFTPTAARQMTTEAVKLLGGIARS